MLIMVVAVACSFSLRLQWALATGVGWCHARETWMTATKQRRRGVVKPDGGIGLIRICPWWGRVTTASYFGRLFSSPAARTVNGNFDGKVYRPTRSGDEPNRATGSCWNLISKSFGCFRSTAALQLPWDWSYRDSCDLIFKLHWAVPKNNDSFFGKGEGTELIFDHRH